MSGHTTVHYLDMIRHGLAYTWTWTTWIGNISAGIVVFVVVSLFWPRARRAIKAFVEGHVKGIHDKLDAQHEEVLRQAEVHHKQHLDLAKKHHAAVLATLKPEPDTKPPASKRGLRKAPHDPEHI